MSETMKYRLSGKKDFYVPVVEKVSSPTEENVTSATTPEWMIRIPGLTESNIEGFTDYCELLGWFGEASRKINASNTIFPAASLKHSEVVVVIPTGGYLATLENKMNDGEPLETIEIINFAQSQKLQSVIYSVCTMSSIQQELEKAVIKMSIVRKENIINVFKNGLPTGQKVSYVDYSTGKTEK